MSLRRFFGVCAALVVLAGIVLCRTYWVGRQTAYAASAGGQTVQQLPQPPDILLPVTAVLHAKAVLYHVR